MAARGAAAGSCRYPFTDGRSKRFPVDFTFPPDSLASDSGPARGIEIPCELSHRARIVGDPDVATQRMALAGAAAGSLGMDVLELAAGHGHRSRALAETAEVGRQRTFAVETPQRAHAVADARE